MPNVCKFTFSVQSARQKKNNSPKDMERRVPFVHAMSLNVTDSVSK